MIPEFYFKPFTRNDGHKDFMSKLCVRTLCFWEQGMNKKLRKRIITSTTQAGCVEAERERERESSVRQTGPTDGPTDVYSNEHTLLSFPKQTQSSED